TPQARTRTSTSSSPGTGTGRSSSSNRCGATSTVAFIVRGISIASSPSGVTLCQTFRHNSRTNEEGVAMNLLDPVERASVLQADTYAYRSPIPTQHVSSDEFMPSPQTRDQQRVEARIKELGGELGRRQGLSRRRFLATASGMAAAFVAMNEVYGPLYRVTAAEAADRQMAAERAKSLQDQFVMDCHTHFLRDDTRITGFVLQRPAIA